MHANTPKGTKLSPSTKTPLVLLAKTPTADGHKQPVARGWPDLTPTLEEVERWVREGGGVGINLAKSTSVSAIDIDTRSPDADHIADVLGRQGALVCRTLRGWHIYIKRTPGSPPPGRYLLLVDGRAVEVEWHPGGPGDVRQLVLPVAGTPRAMLGGGVDFMMGHEWTGAGVDLYALLKVFSMLPDLSSAFTLEPIPTRPAPQASGGQAQEGESVIERVAGKKNPSLQDVLNAVRSTPPRNGERHTFFTPLAAAVWVRWKLRGVLALRELMLEVWGDDADEDEIDAILESAMLKFQASANAKQKKRSHEEIFEKLVESGARWLAREGEAFLVVEGWAVPEERVWDWLSARGEHLSKIAAEAIVARGREELPRLSKDDVVIATNYVQLKEGRAYVLLEGGKVWEATRDGVQVHDTPPAGVLRRWGVETGRVMAQGSVEELVAVVQSFTQRDGRAMLAILAPVVMGLAHGVLVVEGDSGAGKSTLSKFLQSIANSNVTMTLGRDARDWIAAARSNLLLGLDEKGFSEDFIDFVKTCVSGSSATVRKLYTTADNITFELRNSFVFSSVSFDSIPADLARRAIVLNLVRPAGRADLTEQELMELLKREKDVFFSVLFQLLPRVLALLHNEDTRRLSEALAGVRRATSAPAWAREDSKADWAQAAWAFGEVLGCAADVERMWGELRAVAASKGLRAWGEVLRLYEESELFREKITSGMLAIEIAQAIEEDSSQHKALSIRISRQAPAVRTTLRTLGYDLVIEDRWTGMRNKRKYYSLRKVDNDPPKPTPPQPTTRPTPPPAPPTPPPAPKTPQPAPQQPAPRPAAPAPPPPKPAPTPPPASSEGGACVKLDCGSVAEYAPARVAGYMYVRCATCMHKYAMHLYKADDEEMKAEAEQLFVISPCPAKFEEPPF